MEWTNLTIQKKKAIENRFWKHVNKKSDDECWEWMGGKIPGGYGNFMVFYDPPKRKQITAHRFAYMLSNNIEYLSRDLFVCHSCDNPPCCNPKHLWLGSNKSNQIDYFAKGLPNNHPTGKDNHSTKLTETQVLEIRELRKDGLSMHKIARRFDVGDSTVFYILKRHTWKQI